MMMMVLSQRLRWTAGRGIGLPWRPSLLAMTAVAAGVAAVVNAVALATPAVPDTEVPTRLGTALAQSMSDRDRALRDRDRTLELREQAARAAERRLRNDLQTSQPVAEAAPATQATLPGPPPPSPQDAMFANLARIYQTMRPNRAAPIFEKLALDVQVQVAKRMREGQTAQIMAAMAPDAAVDLSMALAGRQVVKAPPPPAVTALRPNSVMRPNAGARLGLRGRGSANVVSGRGAPLAKGARESTTALAASAMPASLPMTSDLDKGRRTGAR